MNLNKYKVITLVLYIAMILALSSSVNHLAFTFGTLEINPLLGWIPAISVDAGLLALSYSINQRKKVKRNTKSLWIGVVFFAIISAIANLYHALFIQIGKSITIETLRTVDWLQMVMAIVLSSVLPIMVIYLSEIISGDDAQEAVRVEQDKLKAERKAERDLIKQEEEHKKELIEQEKIKVNQELSEAISELEQEFQCPDCFKQFKNIKALAGHKKIHSVKVLQTED
jgi:hypothetical protein